MLLFTVTGLVAGLGWTLYNAIVNGAKIGIASLFVLVIGNVIGAYVVDFLAEKNDRVGGFGSTTEEVEAEMIEADV